jgi:hypothetical protein
LISVRSVLRQVPDPRGRQGRQHPLDALLGLVLLSMISGRKGMRAAFRLGRGLSRKQLTRLGFRRDRSSPCHATFTQTLRILDPDALAEAFSQFTIDQEEYEGNETMRRQLSIDGKTLRGSKDADGKAEHVLSAFCAALGQSLGHSSSRGKGMEIPDAMRLLEKINLEGMIVTGDAIFCQKTIASRIVEKGGDYVLPVKRNQKDLHEEIATAFNEPVFPPRAMAGTAATRSRAN